MPDEEEEQPEKKQKRRKVDSMKYKAVVGVTATTVGTLLVTAFVVFQGMANIPWAPKAEVEDNALQIKSLHVMKVQDNKWYLELSTDFATMKANQVHMKENQVEFKEDLREIKQLIRNRR